MVIAWSREKEGRKVGEVGRAGVGVGVVVGNGRTEIVGNGVGGDGRNAW